MTLDSSLDSGRIVFAKRNDPAVQKIIDDWIAESIYGLVSITHMMNPSCFILGGGVMEQPVDIIYYAHNAAISISR